jgi:uncharacterized protein (UPF0332 family)
LTIEDNDRIDLIKYRLQQAEEVVSDVELLINNNRFRSAVNRIYYGMFYSLLALGLAEGFETSKHAQLIGWFNKNFVYSGKINDRFGKIVTKAYNRRTKSDYDTFVTYEKDKVLQMFTEMKDFIGEIKLHLNLP